jgi:hypothetical protein
MGTTKALGDTAFRDYEVDGVASSGDHQVIKSDVRAVFADADTRLGNLEANRILDWPDGGRSRPGP